MRDTIFLSIKPEYMNQIISGKKYIELRKCKPKEDIKHIILYSTFPICAVVGICDVDEIIEESPSALWHRFPKGMGVTREFYESYYQNSKIAFGFKIKNVKKFKNQLTLYNLKKDFPSFSPPQTFKYFDILYFLKFIE